MTFCKKHPFRPFRLITKTTIERIMKHWVMFADPARQNAECTRKLDAWADFAHQQYCSALCIGLGTWLGKSTSMGPHSPNRPLIILAVILFLAGLVSDWRLRTLHESFPDQTPAGNTQVSQNSQAQVTVTLELLAKPAFFKVKLEGQGMTPEPAAENAENSKVS
jgi:hypothetical protein